MLFLDTDIVIDILRKHPPAIAWLDSLAENEELLLSGFVVMELLQGCSNRNEQRIVEKEIAPFAKVWPDAQVCNESLSLFSKFYLSDGLGIIDAIVGQTAVSFDIPLYTFNAKHYRVIPSLQIYQPYKR